MDSLLQHFAGAADIGHLGLFLWAAGASAMLRHLLAELAAANRRFDAFVRELARFNSRHRHSPEGDQS